MNHVDIFYQGEGIAEIQHLEIDAADTFAALKTKICGKHGLSVETMVFIEDSDDPVDESSPVQERAGAAGIKVHLHRCRHVKVSVTFNNETVEQTFAPSATITRIKRWAAERKFGISEAEAGEHVLQIAGTTDRPSPGTHVGTLVVCAACRIAFDLVPDERINGATGAAA